MSDFPKGQGALASPVAGVRNLLSDGPAWFLTRRNWVQFLVWFLVVLGVKHASLLEPPVWDSAMGVFPAAIYLYETNFDIGSLLQEKNWTEGGPNVHSLSILTWVIAGAMMITHSPEATFVIVHLLIFAVFAWTLQLFSRVLHSYGLAAWTVLAAATALLLMPIVLVQVGYMYTESLVMGMSVAAWAYWREGRPGLAVLACVIGILLKLTAIAIAASVFVVVLLSARRLGKRSIALAAAIPGAFLVHRSLPRWLGASPQDGPDWGTPQQLMTKAIARMETIPDVRLLLVAGLLSSVLYMLVRIWRDRGFDFLTRADPDSRSRLICLAMPFAFGGGIWMAIQNNNLFLARYLLPVLPFAIGAVLLFAAQLRAERIAFVLLIGLALYSAANFQGRLYRPLHASFSIVERSHAYRGFHAVQVAAIQALARKPDELPAFVSREVDYMISHRMMGYVEEPIANTHPIYVAPYFERPLAEYPNGFLLVQTNGGHGGGKMIRLVETARATGGYEVKEEIIERAPFRAMLYQVRRVGLQNAEVTEAGDLGIPAAEQPRR